MNLNLLTFNHLTSIKSGFISIGLVVAFCLGCTNLQSNKNVSNTEPKASPKTEELSTKTEPKASPKTEELSTKTEKSSVVDIPKLMNQSPEVFEDTFGVPIKTCSREGYKLSVCNYEIEGLTKPAQTDAGLTVFFVENRAVRINVDLLKQTNNIEEVFSQVKIDIKNVKPEIKSKTGDTWKNQIFNGIRFKTLSAAKLDLDNENYTTIQAFVE